MSRCISIWHAPHDRRRERRVRWPGLFGGTVSGAHGGAGGNGGFGYNSGGVSGSGGHGGTGGGNGTAGGDDSPGNNFP
jgi:endoglucanase